MWLYPDGAVRFIRYLLSEINTILPVSYEVAVKSQANLKSTFQGMISVSSKGELTYTFMWTLKRMWHWSSQLTPEYLHPYCATPEFFGNNSVDYNQQSTH